MEQRLVGANARHIALQVRSRGCKGDFLRILLPEARDMPNKRCGRLPHQSVFSSGNLIEGLGGSAAPEASL